MGGSNRQPAGGGRFVLVVDDDEGSRSLAAMLLASEGYRPTTAGSVERALERLGGVDVVLTDLLMPGRDGFELMAVLRERRPRTPVIAMTGSDDSELVRRALALDACAVLAKPLVPDLLALALADALADAGAGCGGLQPIGTAA